ncbi:alanine racemase [Leuconostocaceae bacterium ESL0723]|nr:alanine racemase [Leuconostocaceae bacterium ESL0723]
MAGSNRIEIDEDILDLRPSWLTVDLAAIQHNAQVLMAHAGAKRLIAVVKANAYGHGVGQVAKALLAIGVKDFAVATVGEGVQLRQILPQSDVNITLLGVQPVEDAVTMVNYQLMPAVGDLDWLTKAAELIGPDRPSLGIQLAVNTGMGRIGAASADDVADLYQRIEDDEHFRLGGVFTHYATADDTNQEYYDRQRKRFADWVTAAGIPKKYWHQANSGSALYHADQIDTDTIRVGSVLYGYNPGDPLLKTDVDLRPAMALHTRIGGVHQLQPGDGVSYGATYVADKPQWVATLPIGYADGYIRRFGGMRVLVNGHAEHVIGRVTMDQIVITLQEPLPVGTEVTLLGRDGDQAITIEELAAKGETIPHEVLTNFSVRLPRHYRS